MEPLQRGLERLQALEQRAGAGDGQGVTAFETGQVQGGLGHGRQGGAAMPSARRQF
jgi:hypothetical protein